MDHRLTKVSFTRLVIAKTTWDSRNRYRQLLRTLDCDWRADPKLLRQHIVTTLSDVWHDDVHRHEARLQHSLQQHLVEFGQSRRTYRIKTHLSDFTWQLVLDKRDCKKRLRLAEASRSTLLLATFFHTWASTVTPIDLRHSSRYPMLNVRRMIVEPHNCNGSSKPLQEGRQRRSGQMTVAFMSPWR